MPNRFTYPRPEYPRPDRQRGTLEGINWLNLNGPWQFRFDGEKRGVEEKWFAPDTPEWREQIIVPFCWESLAAWGDGDMAGARLARGREGRSRRSPRRSPVVAGRARARSRLARTKRTAYFTAVGRL